MEKYKIVGNISAGGHGIVLEAIWSPNYSIDFVPSDEREEKKFAIKRVFMRKQNLTLSVVREIKSLQLLNHYAHIVSLLDIYVRGSSINMVFPLLPANLSALIYEHEMTNYQKAAYTFMLLDGVEHCHKYGILHRDLKPSNLLIDWDGILKICDFGQARILPEKSEPISTLLSHQVCTRGYRSPELLYGSNSYDASIDLWPIGCIVGEMNQKWPLFKGESDIEQLCMVVKQLGKPPDSWSNLPDYNKVYIIFDDELADNSKDKSLQSNEHQMKWHEKLLKICNDAMAVDFVRSVCKYENRSSIKEMKNHNYISKFKNVNYDRGQLLKVNKIRQPIGPPNRR